MFVEFCIIFQAGAFGSGPGPNFGPKAGPKPTQNLPKLKAVGSLFLAVLKIIFNFVLGPPLPRGVPGEGPECHVPKEIAGVGPIPARILDF